MRSRQLFCVTYELCDLFCAWVWSEGVIEPGVRVCLGEELGENEICGFRGVEYSWFVPSMLLSATHLLAGLYGPPVLVSLPVRSPEMPNDVLP